LEQESEQAKKDVLAAQAMIQMLEEAQLQQAHTQQERTPSPSQVSVT